MAGEVWIIGASKGLGLEVARVFARRRRHVVGFARHDPADASPFAAFHRLDLGDSGALDDNFRRLFAAGGTPELIIYNAAQVYQGPVVQHPHETMRAEMDANYLGFVRLCQATAKFKPQGARIRIVATGSTLAYVGCPSLDNYSASKAALLSFARSARREHAPNGLSLHKISPPHMDNGGADLVGPRQFSLAWSAEQFVRAAEGGVRERLLGQSNRLVLFLMRLSPRFAQWIMDNIGADALKRGARRMPA
jgi:3-oxoacyl-[acyl-carrier protein] reductase